jgi:hypothetical protein
MSHHVSPRLHMRRLSMRQQSADAGHMHAARALPARAGRWQTEGDVAPCQTRRPGHMPAKARVRVSAARASAPGCRDPKPMRPPPRAAAAA